MSSEFAARKKRTFSDTNPAPEGDHRKRRRNRTTQSCLNCHTSKRMCDRKRPACARCTQLGLTGLCVYEVDDPSQRSETQDESSRLLKRVAELEGVIRELKNKPHPRWVQSGCSPGGEFEKWHSRSHTRTGGHEVSLSDQPSNASSPPSSPSPLDKAETGCIGSSSSTRCSSISNSPNVYPSSIHLHTETTRSSSSSYYGNSPLNTPSPSTMTPTDEFSQSSVAIVGQTDVTHDFDLTSMLLSYPGLIGCEDPSYAISKDSQREQYCFTKHQGDHCGCLHESTSYNVVLELSLRLRKAADVLARSSSHHIGSNCLLNEHISELDIFVTNTLGNIATPPEDTSSPLTPQDRSRSNSLTSTMVPSSNDYGSGPCRLLPAPTISPQSLHSLRPWDLMSAVSDSSAPCDDSFMSWESSRRS